MNQFRKQGRRLVYKFAIALLVSAFCCGAGPISGRLATGNILDWDLTGSDPAATITSFQLLGPPESGTNSQVGVSGSDLTETSSQLFFNFTIARGRPRHCASQTILAYNDLDIAVKTF